MKKSNVVSIVLSAVAAAASIAALALAIVSLVKSCGVKKITAAEYNYYGIPDDDEDEDEPYIDEYNSINDAQSVEQDLISRKRRLTARTVISAIITLLLIAITCSDSLFPFGQPPYFIAIGVLLGLAVITNISTFSSLISVFTLKNDINNLISENLYCNFVKSVAENFTIDCCRI